MSRLMVSSFKLLQEHLETLAKRHWLDKHAVHAESGTSYPSGIAGGMSHYVAVNAAEWYKLFSCLRFLFDASITACVSKLKLRLDF